MRKTDSYILQLFAFCKVNITKFLHAFLEVLTNTFLTNIYWCFLPKIILWFSEQLKIVVTFHKNEAWFLCQTEKAEIAA